MAYELSEGGLEFPESNLFPNVDGIKFLTHSMGCGGTRDDARTLCGLLAGYITHPNVAGATVLSLGCQNAQISLRSEEHTSELQSLMRISYAVFCLKKKT